MNWEKGGMKGLREEKTGGYVLQQHQHHRYNRGIPAMVCVDVCVRVYVCDNVCMHTYVRLCVCFPYLCFYTSVFLVYFSAVPTERARPHHFFLSELCMLPSVQCPSALNTASSHRFTKTFIVCWRMVENKQLMTGRDRPQVTFQLPPAAAPSTAAPRLSW